MKERIKRFIEIQEEINLKELFTNPVRLFSYTYFYVLIVIVGIGIYFVQNLTLINKNSIIPFVTVDSMSIVKDLSFSLPVDTPPVDVFKFSEPTPQLVEIGKKFYNSNCSSCHGDQGKGDGLAGQLMNPKPRNLTSNSGWINGRKISQMYKTLQEGILANGMPSFNHINPEELFAVIHYIRTFANDFPVDSRDDLQALSDTYKLAEGKKSAGQIPTSKAMVLVLTENSSKQSSFDKIVNGLTTEGEFSDLILSKDKLAGFLINHTNSNTDFKDFVQILESYPVFYGVNPKFVFLNLKEKENFYNYLMSFIRERN